MVEESSPFFFPFETHLHLSSTIISNGDISQELRRKLKLSNYKGAKKTFSGVKIHCQKPRSRSFVLWYSQLQYKDVKAGK